MKTFWKKIKLFFREVGNILTNLLCPVIAVVIAGMELCQFPIAWIKLLKKIEYWCWKACGTQETIEKIIETIDKKITE